MDTEQIANMSKSIQELLDSLPCQYSANCDAESCEYYRICCNLIEARDGLDFMLTVDDDF